MTNTTTPTKEREMRPVLVTILESVRKTVKRGSTPSLPSVPSSVFFTDADDESGITTIRRGPMTAQEIEAFCDELEIKNAIWVQVRQAEENARQTQAEKDATDLLAQIERRHAQRMFVKILTGVATLAAAYGAGRFASIRTGK